MDGRTVADHASGSCVQKIITGNNLYTWFSKCICEALVKVLHHGVRSILCLEITEMISIILFCS